MWYATEPDKLECYIRAEQAPPNPARDIVLIEAAPSAGQLTIPTFVMTKESWPVPFPSDSTLLAPKGHRQ